jgi:hypothetical protein
VWTPLSAQARTALTESHGMTARAKIYSPLYGELDLPIDGGQIDADAGRQVRRTGSVLADPSLWPRSPQSLLAPFGAEMQVDYGIALRSGNIEWVPVIRGSLDDTQRARPFSSSSDVEVKLVDRAARVAEAKLKVPSQTRSGFSAVAEITRIVTEVLPSTQVNDKTGISSAAAVIDIPRERWDEGVERLADGIAAEACFDAAGVLVIRPQPTLADQIVWYARTRDFSTLVGANDRLTREGVYNEIAVSGQRSDGTPPVYAVAQDTDPNSPTYIGGPFGAKTYTYTSALLTTVPQAQATANALLARVRGGGVLSTFDALVNPALEPGDVVGVLGDDGSIQQRMILDKVSIPLSPKGTQALASRSDQLPTE